MKYCIRIINVSVLKDPCTNINMLKITKTYGLNGHKLKVQDTSSKFLIESATSKITPKKMIKNPLILWWGRRTHSLIAKKSYGKVKNILSLRILRNTVMWSNLSRAEWLKVW